jgi:hypothetical protein
MKAKDIGLLDEMSSLLTTAKLDNSDLITVADRVDILRANLELQDQTWDHRVVQHIATLDSAATFAPKTPEQDHQRQAAINNAIAEILRLIEQKRNYSG